MGIDGRHGWVVWLPLAGIVAWVAATAPVSVSLTAGGLAVLAAAGAVVRVVLPDNQPFRVRRRVVDVAILGAFALLLGYLALTGRLG